MTKWIATVALLTLAYVPLRADITLVQTMTMEGAAAAMMQGGKMPKTVVRIKGMKSRSDIEIMGQTMSAIGDLAAKQVILLDSAKKTARIITPDAVAAGAKGLTMPDMDVSLKPTGKSQVIEGQSCDEHAFTMKIDMGSMMGGGAEGMPPEAAAAMQGVMMVMDGSIWMAKSAPGAEEYAAYSKAAVSANLLGALSGMKPGQSNGIDKLMAATASVVGIPYLTEINMTFEGSGPMVAAMAQMGPMKMIQRVSSVSTEPITDDNFKLPEGYTIEKQ